MYSDGAVVAARCYINPLTDQNTGICVLQVIASRLSMTETQPLFGVSNEAPYITVPFLAVCLLVPPTPVGRKIISSSLIACSYGKIAAHVVSVP